MPDPVCPFQIDRPVMQHRWERLAFLHWSFEPNDVQQLLPGWLRVQPFEGRAWVGLVPFFMRVATGRGLRLPWLSNFCETNVRTYVVDRQGREGIWFFSLDAERLPAVLVARSTYRLPYFWSRMRLSREGSLVTYTCQRRWPDGGAVSSVRLRVGEPFGDDDLTDLDHFLTARWILFSSSGDRHRFARAAHKPWPLQRVIPVAIDDGLIRAAGLPSPRTEPICHWSPGVDVRIGRPERYERTG